MKNNTPTRIVNKQNTLFTILCEGGAVNKSTAGNRLAQFWEWLGHDKQHKLANEVRLYENPLRFAGLFVKEYMEYEESTGIAQRLAARKPRKVRTDTKAALWRRYVPEIRELKSRLRHLNYNISNPPQGTNGNLYRDNLKKQQDILWNSLEQLETQYEAEKAQLNATGKYVVYPHTQGWGLEHIKMRLRGAAPGEMRKKGYSPHTRIYWTGNEDEKCYSVMYYETDIVEYYENAKTGTVERIVLNTDGWWNGLTVSQMNAVLAEYGVHISLQQNTYKKYQKNTKNHKRGEQTLQINSVMYVKTREDATRCWWCWTTTPTGKVQADAVRVPYIDGVELIVRGKQVVDIRVNEERCVEYFYKDTSTRTDDVRKWRDHPEQKWLDHTERTQFVKQAFREQFKQAVKMLNKTTKGV